jgi:capsid protein
VIAQAIRDGEIPYVPRWDEIDIVWAPMPIVDYKAELQASSLAIEKNLSTLDRETRRLGTGQWEDIVRQKGIEAQTQREAGVMPAMLPGAADPNIKPEESANNDTPDGNADDAAD